MSNRSKTSKPHPLPPLRTKEQAREWLLEQGLTLTQFARDNGLTLDSVRDVLIGRSKARTGNAHAAAVALGIKRNPLKPAESRERPRGR